VWLRLSGRSLFVSFFRRSWLWAGAGTRACSCVVGWTILDVPHSVLELELRARAPGASCRVCVCVDAVMCFVVRVRGRGRGAVAGPSIGLELVRSGGVHLLVLGRSGLYALRELELGLRVLELEPRVHRARACWGAVLWHAHLSGSSLCL
jgi:hypothetical protein